jgi:mRNA interferase RelE/StbE
MTYSIELSRQAKKEVKILDSTTIRRLEQRLEELSKEPGNPRISKPIRMREGHRSSRVGEWRLIYQVNESEKIVLILAISHRGKAYK